MKAIIVTGASRGLGVAVARWLYQAGAAVSLVARSKNALESVAADIDPSQDQVLAISADIAHAAACGDIVAKTVKRFGRLDAIVNNAGILAPLGYIDRADPAAWRYNLDVNVMGPFYLVRAAIGELRKRRGRIVNISSGASTTAIEGASAYCTAKAALNHFTRVLAAEEPDITAVAVRPGVVDTQMQKTLRTQPPQTIPTRWIDYYKELKSDGKLEPPEIPGRTIAYLALHAPPELSGQFINYDDPEIIQAASAFYKRDD